MNASPKGAIYGGECRECGREIEVRLASHREYQGDKGDRHVRCAGCGTINSFGQVGVE